MWAHFQENSTPTIRFENSRAAITPSEMLKIMVLHCTNNCNVNVPSDRAAFSPFRRKKERICSQRCRNCAPERNRQTEMERPRPRQFGKRETEMRGKSELIISNKGPCKAEYLVQQLRFITCNKILILPKYASVEACGWLLETHVFSHVLKGHPEDDDDPVVDHRHRHQGLSTRRHGHIHTEKKSTARSRCYEVLRVHEVTKEWMRFALDNAYICHYHSR